MTHYVIHKQMWVPNPSTGDRMIFENEDCDLLGDYSDKTEALEDANELNIEVNKCTRVGTVVYTVEERKDG